uniref:cytochrome c oxidase subunit 3 n=1 Tax=Tilletia controversa TaxID=13291 RepID=UPI002435F4BC|nr:cytochrome c oxidase subunit 3 [Tilletia controversa]WEX30820.1 cytochrome c oxidase subunit 3 [Tilletia controversa]
MKHFQNNLSTLRAQQFQAQPFHLVTPSPWPLLTSFALLILTSATVMYFNGYTNPLGGSGLLLVGIGFLTTLFAMILWFRDVIIEGTFLGDHTFVVQKGITMGVRLFIISEVFFFVSIFWAFFHSSLSPAIELGSQWPPAGIPTINPFELPLLNTVLLLSSGATITYAHHSLIQGNRRGAISGTILTILFAILFTICQGIEYYNAGFTIADGVYGSTFFFSTGTHGVHVLVGTIFITVGFFRMLSYHLTANHHLGYERAILYWHFVDVVWLFLFITVYWWGS